VELHSVEPVEYICAVLSSRPVSVLWASVDNRNEKNCRYGYEPGVLSVQVLQGILLKVILEILVIVLFSYWLF